MTSRTASACTARAVPPPVESDVRLRSLEPGESEAVLAVFAGMSRSSRESRFLSSKPRLTDVDLQMLTAVDGHDHVAVVASTRDEDRPIGIGRFVRGLDPTDSADVAIAVVDAWQRRGVGTLLLRTLTRRAVEVGVRRLTFNVSPGNRAARCLLGAALEPVSLVHSDHWSSEYAVSLDPMSQNTSLTTDRRRVRSSDPKQPEPPRPDNT